jgi:hypothetical protein
MLRQAQHDIEKLLRGPKIKTQSNEDMRRITEFQDCFMIFYF